MSTALAAAVAAVVMMAAPGVVAASEGLSAEPGVRPALLPRAPGATVSFRWALKPSTASGADADTAQFEVSQSARPRAPPPGPIAEEPEGPASAVTSGVAATLYQLEPARRCRCGAAPILGHPAVSPPP